MLRSGNRGRVCMVRNVAARLTMAGEIDEDETKFRAMWESRYRADGPEKMADWLRAVVPEPCANPVCEKTAEGLARSRDRVVELESQIASLTAERDAAQSEGLRLSIRIARVAAALSENTPAPGNLSRGILARKGTDNAPREGRSV